MSLAKQGTSSPPLLPAQGSFLHTGLSLTWQTASLENWFRVWIASSGVLPLRALRDCSPALPPSFWRGPSKEGKEAPIRGVALPGIASSFHSPLAGTQSIAGNSLSCYKPVYTAFPRRKKGLHRAP